LRVDTLKSFKNKFYNDYMEERKIFQGVLDEKSLMSLYSLMNKGVLDMVHGFVKQGKESSVLVGEDKKGRKVAVKVYAIEASDFKNMWPYLHGDERFKNIKRNKRDIVYAWCAKEHQNLFIARRAGVKCPEPLGSLNNVLVMEFIGDELEPAPRLNEVWLEEPEKVFKSVLEDMKRMYRAGLVHGDLSEFNILFWNGEPWIIDMSQGVLLKHPRAQELLERDVKNVVRFFRKYGVETNEDEVTKVVKGGSE